MDTVIFTEGMPLEEFQRDRPGVPSTGGERRVGPNDDAVASARDVRFWRRLGFTALTIGLVLIGLIVYACSSPTAKLALVAPPCPIPSRVRAGFLKLLFLGWLSVSAPEPCGFSETI